MGEMTLEMRIIFKLVVVERQSALRMNPTSTRGREKARFCCAIFANDPPEGFELNSNRDLGRRSDAERLTP